MRRFAWILGLTHLFVFVFVAGSLFAAEAGTASSPPAASAATIPAEPKVGSPVVAPRAADLVKDFLDAHVGAELGEVMPTNGTGRFRLTKPTSARQILDGGGRPIGYFFRAATLEYDIDPADEPVVDHNLRFIDGLKAPEKGKPLRIEAKEIAWLSLEGPAPDPGKAVVEPPNETLKRALDPRSGVGNPATEFAAARLSGNAPLVAVFAKIGDEHYVAYGFDAELGREGIAALGPRWKLKGREDWLQAATIDERPVGRARQSIDPFPAEVRGIDIRIVEGTGEMGEVTATVDYGFLRHYPALLKVAWMDEGLDYRNPGLVRRFPAEMKSITDAEGHPLPYAKQRDSLLVQLPHRMKPGEVVRLKFAYTLPLIQYGGDRYWRLGEQPWYPMAGGDLRRNAARIRAEVHARKPFTAWGTGRVVKRWEEGDTNCVILEEDGRPISRWWAPEPSSRTSSRTPRGGRSRWSPTPWSAPKGRRASRSSSPASSTTTRRSTRSTPSTT